MQELKDSLTREVDEPFPGFSQLPQQAKDFVTVPVRFFLLSPFHIITTATMDYLQDLLSRADWNMRRFLPSIVIESENGNNNLVEQHWLGEQLTIAHISIQCTATPPRCDALARRQKGLRLTKRCLDRL